ncbi:MAG TPA: M48 family metallopeptidase [Thermoanaerobaculia bacterium]|nr:M48 family metallopeptidase [Thermoanaerobaculia bacterium]
MRTRLLLVCALMLFVAGGAAATLAEKSKEFDARILRELDGNPRATELFKQANEARLREDHRQASDLYGQVYGLAPGFIHALRRQSMEELALGYRDNAAVLARKAVAQQASADNLSALSVILASSKEGQPAPDADRAESLDLARRAAGLEPGNYYAQAALAQAALINDDLGVLGEASARMVSIEPQEFGGHYLQSIAQVSQGSFGKAQASLDRAHQLGLPDAEYQTMSQAFRDAQPRHIRYGIPALEGIAIWIGSLLVLLLLGWVLSRATLRAAQQVPAQPGGQAAGGDRLLRGFYKGVLWLSCLYYYLSIPIIVLLVIAAGGGVIYACFAIGQVPVKLVVIVAAVVVVTLVSIVKSLFARSRDEDPGLKLAPAEEPRLRDLLHEVAGKIGTRPVDNIYLTPGTDLAVMERGGMLKQLRGSSERCLILGVGVLDGMKIAPFKAILAHEYGHFSNKDTAGGGFALSVRRSLMVMGQNLAEGGAAAWYNPAWLFVRGFYRVFLRISQGASRLQEVLADRWAAFAYGAKAFERGLLHVIERSIRFDAHANATLGEVLEGRRALVNLYSYQPSATPDPEEIQAEVKKSIHREPSPYDSHPSPVKRFLWTRLVPSPGQTSPEDEEEVWTLFRDREALERKLTETVRVNLQMQGIEVPGAA